MPILVEHGQVKMSVVVEVACNSDNRPVAGNKIKRRPEAAVPVAAKHAEGVATLVGHDKIGDAIFIHICGRNRHRIGTDAVTGGRRKAAITLACQDS